MAAMMMRRSGRCLYSPRARRYHHPATAAPRQARARMCGCVPCVALCAGLWVVVVVMNARVVRERGRVEKEVAGRSDIQAARRPALTPRPGVSTSPAQLRTHAKEPVWWWW